MPSDRTIFGLSAGARTRLLEKLSSVRQQPARAAADPPSQSDGARRFDVSQLDGYRDIEALERTAEHLGIANPFFRVHEGMAAAE